VDSLLECWLACWIAWLLDALNAWWLGRLAAKCLLDSLVNKALVNSWVLGYLGTWYLDTRILGYWQVSVKSAHNREAFHIFGH
jgi:hypothetical protein